MGSFCNFVKKFQDQGAVRVLYEELQVLADANKKRNKPKTKEEENKPQADALTMEMDKGHKFVVMRRIMKSAQQAEFIAFKLMVAKLTE